MGHNPALPARNYPFSDNQQLPVQHQLGTTKAIQPLSSSYQHGLYGENNNNLPQQPMGSRLHPTLVSGGQYQPLNILQNKGIPDKRLPHVMYS